MPSAQTIRLGLSIRPDQLQGVALQRQAQGPWVCQGYWQEWVRSGQTPGQTLSRLYRQIPKPFTNAPAAFLVPAHQITLKWLTDLPAGGDMSEHIRTVIRAELQGAFDRSVYSHLAFPGQRTNAALVTWAAADTIRQSMEEWARSGFKSARPMGPAQAAHGLLTDPGFPLAQEEFVAWLDTGDWNSYLWVVGPGGMRWGRTLQVSRADWLQGLQGVWSSDRGRVSMDAAQATSVLQRITLDPEPALASSGEIPSGLLKGLVSPILEQQTREIARTLQFSRDAGDMPVQRIWISGVLAGINGIERAWSRSLGCSVQILSEHPRWEPWQQEHRLGPWAIESPLLVGAALSDPSPELVPLDIQSAQHQWTLQDQWQGWSLRLRRPLAAVCVVLFLLGFVVHLWHRRLVAQVSQSAAAVATYQQLSTMRDQRLERLEQITRRQVRFPEVLKELSHITPELIILSQMAFEASDRTLQLDGNLSAEDPAWLTQFLRALEGSPFFSKAELVSSERADAAAQAVSFTIRCRVIERGTS